jgi:DNA replication and repair protein RecF
VLVTAAVPEDVPQDWDARKVEIVMNDDETGRISEVRAMNVRAEDE